MAVNTPLVHLPEQTEDVSEASMGSAFRYYVYYGAGTDCEDLKDYFVESIENIVVDGPNGIYYI